MKRINLDQMKNMSIDNLIELYRDGYRLEEHTPITSLSNLPNFSNIHALQGPLLDPVVNFGKVTVSTGYDATATSIILNTNEGSKLPDPSSAFNLVWWNSTDYPDPSDDPNKEIVRCTTRTTDTLTVVRPQEGTSASIKNLVGKTYKMILSPTAKMISDISSAITASADHIAAVAPHSGHDTPAQRDTAIGTAVGNHAGLITGVHGVTGSYILGTEDIGIINGVAGLDANGKIPTSQLPALAITDVYTIASDVAQIALVAQTGDVAIRTDQNKSYVHNGGVTGTMADWSLLLTPTDAVLSAFGRTGAIAATTNDYTWAQINKATSSIADITTRSHTSLTDIGTNTHATIDTHIAATGTSVHGSGTMSTQFASTVAITGGAITGITDITVADGGTGRSVTVAYTPICGGTSTTSAHQSVASLGDAGQVLTSNGLGALPTFQAIPVSSSTYEASTNIRNSHDAIATSTSATYVLMKKITLNAAYVGSIRVDFSMKSQSPGYIKYARIYKNGVAFGTEHDCGTISTAWCTFSETFTGLNMASGETFEIWAYAPTSGYVGIQSFRLLYDLTTTVASTNS